jgi:uncharacterized membrane protein required for colicin V production
VDLLAVIIVVRSTYVGPRRGFFGELFYILGFYLAIIASVHFYPFGSNFINKYLYIPLNISDLISFLIIISCVYFAVKSSYGLLQKLIRIEIFPAINNIIGLLLGFCKGFIISALLILIMLLVPVSYITDSVKAKSLFSPFLIKTGVALYKQGLSMISNVEPRDLTQFLSGAKPLDFKIFKLKRKDKLDEILQ